MAVSTFRVLPDVLLNCRAATLSSADQMELSGNGEGSSEGLNMCNNHALQPESHVQLLLLLGRWLALAYT